MLRSVSLLLIAFAVTSLTLRAHAGETNTVFDEILAQQGGKSQKHSAPGNAGTNESEARRRARQDREEKTRLALESKESQDREKEDATLEKMLANPAIQQALAEARAYFWQGKFPDAEQRLRALERGAPGRIPECEALLARLSLRKNPAAAKLVAAALHTAPRTDLETIPPERREAALVCLRANLMLAMQPSAEAGQLLTQTPKTPAFQGVPYIGDSLAFARAADWSPLHAIADRIAADCDGATDPVAQLHQIEAALLAGDALVLCNRWDEAKGAYEFAISQGRGHNERAQQPANYEPEGKPSPIPAPLIAEAQSRLGQLKSLEEIKHLSLDFIRYRDAETKRLAGKTKDAIVAYDLLMNESNVRRQAAIAAARDEATKSKRKFDAAAFTPEPESPFEAAAVCYRAKCRLELGDEKSVRQAMVELEDFIQKDGLGLYRGEALLELAEGALDNFAFDSAKPYLARLETWVANARPENRDEKFAALFAKLPSAAQEIIKPPEHEWMRDGWGKFIRQNPKPGELVNRWTCGWYLDDLEEHLVLYQGFLMFIQGQTQENRDAAKAKWSRIKELDPLCSLDAGSSNPTNWTRLRIWCEHRQGYASMEEAAIFKGTPIHDMVALGDFYALTCRWSKAERVGQKLLAQRNLAQGLKDYGWLLVGSANAWQGDRGGAYDAYRAALKTKEDTPTEIRCWYCLANMMRTDKDEAHRQEAKRMLGEMVALKLQGEWGCKACVALAMIYKDQDKDYPAAIEALEAYPKKDDRWSKVIAAYRRLTETAMANATN